MFLIRMFKNLESVKSLGTLLFSKSFSRVADSKLNSAVSLTFQINFDISIGRRVFERI